MTTAFETDALNTENVLAQEFIHVRKSTNSLEMIGTLLFVGYYVMLFAVYGFLIWGKGMSFRTWYFWAILISFILFPMLALLLESVIFRVVELIYGTLIGTQRIPSLDNVFLNQSTYSVNAGPPNKNK
jgi:hypothetical protein